MEIWKDIKGYEGKYKVSDKGRVKSVVRKGRLQDKIRKTVIQNGYEYVNLTKDKRTENKLVHRLVAETFIDNPEGKREVNHVNGNKSDNRVKNLEWVTPKENVLHSYKELNRKPVHLNKKVIQLTKDGKQIKIWNSIKEAASHYGTSPTNITKCVTGKNKTAKGFKWILCK